MAKGDFICGATGPLSAESEADGADIPAPQPQSGTEAGACDCFPTPDNPDHHPTCPASLAVKEVEPDSAPAWYSSEEASAWAAGYNAARAPHQSGTPAIFTPDTVYLLRDVADTVDEHFLTAEERASGHSTANAIDLRRLASRIRRSLSAAPGTAEPR